MLYSIQNPYLHVQICDIGAELHSICDRNGLERLWQADPAVWEGHAPLLFPVIARLKNETYSLDGTPYRMPIHGFAGAKRFSVTEQRENSITFTLESDADTRACYPFDFVLTVCFALDGPRLTKTCTVYNCSASVMPFELGGHDGLCTALHPGERMEDYYVEFPGSTVLHARCSDENLMLLDQTREVPLDAERLYLTPEVFALDALILENLPASTVTLGSRKSAAKVTLSFTGFPYLGVWSRYAPRKGNYVCLEPWSALPDCAYLDTELANKHGVRLLQPNVCDTLAYTLEFQ